MDQHGAHFSYPGNVYSIGPHNTGKAAESGHKGHYPVHKIPRASEFPGYGQSMVRSPANDLNSHTNFNSPVEALCMSREFSNNSNGSNHSGSSISSYEETLSPKTPLTNISMSTWYYDADDQSPYASYEEHADGWYPISTSVPPSYYEQGQNYELSPLDMEAVDVHCIADE